MPTSTVVVKDAKAGICEVAQQPEKLQWYFMNKTEDMAKGSKMSDFFVTNAINSDNQSIASLHQDFHDAVGGISATVVPGNSAGYIGGLTANKAIAESLYAPSDSQSDACFQVGRCEEKLREDLLGVMASDARHVTSDRSREQTIEIEARVASVPVRGGNLSFRDYRHMRTGRVTRAVVKSEKMVPLFGPCAWERLHGHLRSIAFSFVMDQRPVTERERMFCTESDEDFWQTCPDSNVTFGLPLVQCFMERGLVVFEDATGAIEVSDELRDLVQGCMQELGLAYSNAVYQGVSSVEDCGYAYTSVYNRDMTDPRYRHARNKAVVYTVGPNGNKQRYQSDVHVLPTPEAWHARTRLVGENVARSVAAYNALVARGRATGLLPITVMRTCLISGGAFMLRDLADKPIVTFKEHACSYQQGLLHVLRCASTDTEGRLRRVEFIYTPDEKGQDEVFQQSFELAATDADLPVIV